MLQKAGDLDKVNIMIVDDIPDSLRLLVTMLKRAGYNTYSAYSSQHALHIIPQAAPDLFLLDIMMPGMNGYDLCKRLKADEATAEIPVIFISAMNQLFDKVTAFEVGGVDYITKPFQEQEVLARINTHLTLDYMRRRLAQRNQELEEALERIKTLRGLLPICANCKKIRDDKGYWTQVEVYIQKHSEADFSHSICPSCLPKMYPDLYPPDSR